LPPHAARSIYYADNWEDASGFVPDTYLDIGAVFDRWQNACEAFPMWRGATGFRYHDYYTGRAVCCGCLSQCAHAVALMSPADQRIRHIGLL
jgi:hypothetical protein